MMKAVLKDRKTGTEHAQSSRQFDLLTSQLAHELGNLGCSLLPSRRRIFQCIVFVATMTFVAAVMEAKMQGCIRARNLIATS